MGSEPDNGGDAIEEDGLEQAGTTRVLNTMARAKVEANTISYSAAISAGEKDGLEQVGTTRVLNTMARAKVEVNTIGYNVTKSACEKR